MQQNYCASGYFIPEFTEFAHFIRSWPDTGVDPGRVRFRPRSCRAGVLRDVYSPDCRHHWPGGSVPGVLFDKIILDVNVFGVDQSVSWILNGAGYIHDTISQMVINVNWRCLRLSLYSSSCSSLVLYTLYRCV